MSNKIKNIIDFHGATHGHFLEYIINTWIYNGPRVPRVFTELGTSHLPKQNPDYRANCMIKCEHYTEYQVVNQVVQDPPKKIVRITVESTVGQQIHMVNVMNRVGDITLETSYKLIPLDVLNVPVLLRTNWFSKLTDAENRYKLDYKWRWPDADAFEFPMENLYDLTLFYQTLQRCGDFLEQKFTPDQELYITWQQFIDMNQGLQCYKKSKKIVELALANQDFEFDSNESEQALINAILTNTVNMYDGPMFNNNLYPTNTMQIWQYIQAHLKEFDNKY
jgi:hypothetical protein